MKKDEVKAAERKGMIATVIETVATIALAAKYSFLFCLRNAKYETLAKFAIVLVVTVLGYMNTYSFSLIVGGLQKELANKGDRAFVLMDLITGPLKIPVITMVAVIILDVFVGRFMWYIGSRFSQKLNQANNLEVNSHKGSLDVAKFRSKELDDLNERVGNLPGGWHTRISFTNEMFGLLSTCVSFVLYGLSLVWYKPEYAAALLVACLPMAIFEFISVSMWWEMHKELVPVKKRRSVMEKAFHNPTTFTQAKSFGQMKVLDRMVRKNMNFALGRYNQLRNTTVIREMMTHTFAKAGLIGVVIHCVYLTLTGKMDMQYLTFICAAARVFQSNMEGVVSLVAEQWNNAKGVILIEKEFFGMKPLIQTTDPINHRFTKPPGIVFDKVCFSYPGSDVLAVKNISFSIKPGERVAIIGKSGGGKSTLAALLMREYDPTSGSITVGDLPLNRIAPDVWHQTISTLAQDFTVLPRKVKNEIASSKLGEYVDIDAVKTAAEGACFAEVVDKDEAGFDQQIGTEFGGKEYSGGERQRLALARVLYLGTPVLILDEPDARLDPETANKVMDNVFKMKDEKTVFMIIHHVTLAARCSKIITIDGGEIKEIGTHNELVNSGGVYSKLLQEDKNRSAFA